MHFFPFFDWANNEPTLSTSSFIMGKLKLTYFNLRGRAELARLIMAEAGVEYEDCRVAGEQWQQIKPGTPFGQLPILEVDGEVIAESMAIARYLARENGLAGADNLEAARADMFVDGLSGMLNKLVVIKHDKSKSDEEKKKAMTEFGKDTLVPFIKVIEKNLVAKGTKFLVGDKLTWADIAFYDWNFLMKSQCDQNLLTDCPKLQAVVKSVEERPNIAKWIAERPESSL